MQVHLCGVRGSTPAPGIDFLRYGGHTSCVALARDGAPAPSLVLDAGSGVQAVTALLDPQPFEGTILLSHLHWDHIFGLPFFTAADRLDAHTTVLLPQQEDRSDAQAVLSRVIAPPFFPVEPHQLRGRWQFGSLDEGEHEIEGLQVIARQIPHKGGRTFGYRISDGRSTLAYLPDHCPTTLGPGEDGFGEYHPAAIELARHVDLLIHDSQLFPEELEAEADFGHSVADYPVELAVRADARAVLLFHHRHDRSDSALDALGRRLAREHPRVTVAVQGELLKL